MSRKHSPTDDLAELRAILAAEGLTTSERIVLIAIVLHRNGESGRCDPSLPTLARETALNERSVRRALQKAQARGYVLCNRRDGRSTCYTISAPTPDTSSPRTQSHPGHDVQAPRAQSPATPDTVSTERTKGTNEVTNEAPTEGARKRAAPRKRGPRKSKSKSERPGWTTLAGERWREAFDGTPNFGAIGKHLKPLVEEHGQDEVLATWGRYLESETPKYASPAAFASKYGAIRSGAWASGNGTKSSTRIVEVDPDDIAAWED